jgi:hypothetical protein
MKILIRKDNQADWELVEAAEYSVETELQELLAESPSLISVEEIREGASPLIIAVREFGLPGSGNTDILAFNSRGDIVVVECKLAANPEIKRKVIAQVLEYGAYLWNMSYDDLNQRVYMRMNKNLAELVGEAEGDPEWDEEIFRTTIEENLTSGSFVLAIAVDEMNDELNRTMRFLNTCGNPNFSFTVLEMRRFYRDDTEILVPNLHGVVSDTQTRGGRIKRKQWTESKYLDEINTELPPEVVEIIIELYKWTKEKADRVWFGTGIEKGSFTFHYLPGGKTVTVFSVYTNGDLTFNYGWLSKEIEIDLLKIFHQGLTNIEPFSHIPAEFNRWPTVKVEEVFKDHPEYLDQFKNVVEDFGNKLERQYSS